MQQLALFNVHYYKLVPTNGAPTLEIDGIRMHRTKGTTPELDAFNKIDALNAHAGRILDTCTGLGYTALGVLSKGIEFVVTIENRPEVLRLASMNPWSKPLFTDFRINSILGDAYYVIESLPSSFFDYVIHDPPRLALAGQLYSFEFYSKLEKVLRRGGRMFHYTGEPGSKYRKLDIRKGVMNRLKEAGFTKLKYLNNIKGIVCEKLN
jgi:predicted methyltransferase